MDEALSVNGTIAVLGGTGALGSGLANRWAKAGLTVVIGTRDPARARAGLDAAGVAMRAMTYADAAAAASLVVLTVPFASQLDVLAQARSGLDGKILIDCTVPLQPPKVGRVQLPAEGSAAQVAQAFLGEGVTVVSAFQNVGATLLQGNAPIHCDVLVCSNSMDARKTGVRLVEAAGLRGIEAGPLANSAAADALTSILITINRHYKSGHAGIRITGIPEFDG